MPLIQPNFLCAHKSQIPASVRKKISLTHDEYVGGLSVSGNAIWTHNESTKGYLVRENVPCAHRDDGRPRFGLKFAMGWVVCRHGVGADWITLK